MKCTECGASRLSDHRDHCSYKISDSELDMYIDRVIGELIEEDRDGS